MLRIDFLFCYRLGITRTLDRLRAQNDPATHDSTRSESRGAGSEENDSIELVTEPWEASTGPRGKLLMQFMLVAAV